MSRRRQFIRSKVVREKDESDSAGADIDVECITRRGDNDTHEYHSSLFILSSLLYSAVVCAF